MKKVSVVVPVYNASAYLKKSLDSLVNQTIDDIEIIVVNDGSTDDSLSIILNYANNYPAMFKIINKENGGQASARNIGIRECSGEYIGFLDSDDYAEITMYEKMYCLAVASNADLVECDYRFLRYIESKEVELKPYCKIRKYRDQKDMFIDPLVSPWNKLYKANLVKDSKVEFVEGFIYEDTSFYLKLIPFIRKQEYIGEQLIHHIFWESSTMNINRNKKVGDIFSVLMDTILFYKSGGYYSDYKEELEYFWSKILLNSSLGRIFQVSDKELRSELMNQTLIIVRDYFPKYRRNKYIRNNKKGIYMKSLNRWTLNIYGWMYRVVKRKGYFIG